MAQLRETVYLESAPSVDAEAGVIRGVKLLGMESRNKRRYTREAMAGAVSMYEGRKVYVDHPNRNEMGDRSMDRWAGTITKATLGEGGIYGDVKLRKKSDFFEGIIEAARDFPKDVGFSHVADGESRMDRGTEIVESINEVFSVDLVTDPATTGGFFESKDKDQPQTVKTAIESLPAGTVRTKLVEMVDAGFIDGALSMGDEDKPVDPLSQMSSLVKELITMLGETLKALAVKQDSPPPAPPAPEEPMADPAPVKEPPVAEVDKAAFESLQRENAELKAKSLLLESGRDASPARIKALASAADADRKALLESWPVAEADGEGRPLRSPALIESEAADADFPRDPEKFAASLR